MSSEDFFELLRDLELKRRNRNISAKEFYKGLLELVKKLTDENKTDGIPEEEIRKQIPILLTFIKAQIKSLP
jgi:hypothetical protein